MARVEQRRSRPASTRSGSTRIPTEALFHTDAARLGAVVRPFGIALDEGARERIVCFAKELILWNDRLNLLSRPDAPNVIRKHVAASLGVFLIRDPAIGERWIDVGTGAGFPGLVLKLVEQELDIALLDSAKKRCTFLENAIRGIGVEPITIHQMRAETLLNHRGGKGAYDVVTCRAVASLGDSLREFSGLVAPGGRFITFKGPSWYEDLEHVRSQTLVPTGMEFEAAVRVPWTFAHLLSFRRPGLSGV